ncbi:MAG: P-II family nitrogen regulator [Desulfobacterales bacterium]|nr:MAG: P-II family nitrogen regulator [Desulfobacterales bacterium]
MNFKLIISMVKTKATDRIVEAAKAAGGTGATIIPARGAGIHEAKTFFGLTLEAQTDVVLFLLEERLVEPVLNAIYDAGRFKEPGTGIAFVVHVECAVGLESQIEHFRREAEKRA